MIFLHRIEFYFTLKLFLWRDFFKRTTESKILPNQTPMFTSIFPYRTNFTLHQYGIYAYSSRVFAFLPIRMNGRISWLPHIKGRLSVRKTNVCLSLFILFANQLHRDLVCYRAVRLTDFTAKNRIVDGIKLWFWLRRQCFPEFLCIFHVISLDFKKMTEKA